ncbi:MAG: hypothetical protein DYG89_29650 [Caldilinea sp. CFX5]|nr:hypothetical protein [Caldilinea sp. CFX5]
MGFFKKLFGIRQHKIQYYPISKFSAESASGIDTHLLVIYNTPGPQDLDSETRKIIKFLKSNSGFGPSLECKVCIITEPISEATNYRKLRAFMQSWLDKDGGHQNFRIMGDEGINAHIQKYGIAQATWATSVERAKASDKAFEKALDEAMASVLGKPTSQPSTSSVGSLFTEEKLTYTTTKNATEVVDALFNKCLPTIPILTVDEVRSEYDFARSRWGSRTLVEGTEEKVKTIIFNYLQRLGKQSDFKEYDVTAIKSQKCVQASATFKKGSRETFTPVRVWRTDNRFFACGDETFS